MPIVEKKFTLTQHFKNVSDLPPQKRLYGEVKDHFNLKWKLCIGHDLDQLQIFLYCLHGQTKKCSIETEFELKLKSMTGKVSTMKLKHSFGKYAFGTVPYEIKFMKWEDMKRDYLIDGNLVIEAQIKILKISGLEMKKLIDFDESSKEFSDVILIVEDEKFYVSKLFLASQSSYFESMFLRNFKESQKSEIHLTGVNSKGFQNLLELLYGASPIDEDTIDGILKLADMYDAKVAIRKCEEFLINESDKTIKEKLRMAKEYNLKVLKNNCLSKINNLTEIRSVLSYDFGEMDPSVVGALLQKSLSLMS